MGSLFPLIELCFETLLLTDQKYKMEIENRNVLWWHRELSYGNQKISLLRTRHPAFAPKGFAKAVSKWIKNDK